MTYHIGLLKAGDKLIVQVARSVDQLSCELWRYCGERITTVAALKRTKEQLRVEVNRVYGTDFKRITVVKIADQDFLAGMVRSQKQY